jgi:hypothetical protein
MGRWNRGLTTLVAAAAAGFLIWCAPHFNRWATGGYWGVIALMALAGLLIGVSQLHGRDGNPTASFLTVFVPVLVVAGWVILAAQPDGGGSGITSSRGAAAWVSAMRCTISASMWRY